MSVPASPINAEWQSTPRMPKLGYRKALSEEEAQELKSQMKESVVKNNNLVRQNSVSSTARPAAPTNPGIASRKKGSFLSGIFAKEPTISALANFEADVKAKYGSATPQAVPHVSSRKMPEHVPKVNSKWDGVPEIVKQREKEEKKRRRLSQQNATSEVPRTGVSQSTNDSTMYSQSSQYRGSGHSSDSTSQAGSAHSGQGKDRRPRRGSVQSSCSSGSHASQGLEKPPGTAWSQTSLPEITYYFPEQGDQTTSVKVPQRWQSTDSNRTCSTDSSAVSRSDASQYTQATSFDPIPEHSSSPLSTPRELSPVTPGYLLDAASTAPEVVPARQLTRPNRVRSVAIDAFLAGEAKPLTLEDSDDDERSDLPLRNYQKSILRVQNDIAQRPDSSRDRLGLRASMVVANDATPWDTQNTVPVESPPVRTSNRTRLPKALALLKK